MKKPCRTDSAAKAYDALVDNEEGILSKDADSKVLVDKRRYLFGEDSVKLHSESLLNTHKQSLFKSVAN